MITQPPQSPEQPVRQEKSNGMSITALVLGLVGLVFGIFVVTGFFGIILGGIGAIFGIVGVVKLGKNKANSKGLAIIGLLVAVAAVILGVFTTVVTVKAVDSAFNGNRGSVGPGSSPSGGQPAGQPNSASWGERYTWKDGLAVEVSAPKPYTPSSSASGRGARAVAVQVTIVNGTQQSYNYNWAIFGPSGATFNGSPISPIIDFTNRVGGAPESQILPGKSLTTTWAFPVEAATGELQMQFEEGFGSARAVFVGQA